MNVLIVDDNATNLKLLRAMLEAEGIVVTQAADGIEALESLECQPCDAIISDILMPRLDGYRLCYEVRANKRFRALPFIVYTSTYLSNSDEKLARELGADTFIRKPASAEVIIAALHEVAGDLQRRAPKLLAPPQELSLMKEYNERLVDKLEARTIELEDLHDHLRRLVAQSPAVIFTLRPDQEQFTPRVASESILTLLGFSMEEALRPGWWEENVHPDDGAVAAAGLAQARAHGAQSVEYRIRHKDGAYRWVENTIRVARNAAGQPSEAIGVWTDITARKEYFERSLQERDAGLNRAETRFRQLLELGPDGIVIVNGSGLIDLVNSQTERLFCYSRNELLGKPVETLIPGKFRAAHPQHRAAYFVQPRVRPMGAGLDLKGRRKDGSEFPVEISLSPIETEEGTLVISSIRDATERKELERALQEKNIDLEKANAAKDFFLSAMSHELRTPLNAILGFTGTLLMGLPGPLTPDQEKQLKTIQTSGKHLLSLVNDLLDLAKIESSTIEIQLLTSSCQEIVAEAVSSLRPLAAAKSIAFEATFPEHPLMVNTDRRALLQIVLNLGSNAIKFTSQGSVRVDVAYSAAAGPPMAAIHVVDTGIGVKAEDQDKLFGKFQRIHGESGKEGSGLGLHLCGKLSELIGGRIEFESQYGRGSRFTLFIPACPSTDTNEKLVE